MQQTKLEHESLQFDLLNTYSSSITVRHSLTGRDLASLSAFTESFTTIV